MNILLFSPVADRSAVARLTRLVVAALVKDGHEVTVVRSEGGSDVYEPARGIAVPIIRWNDRAAVEAAAGTADSAVYQIGNDFRFHQGCLEWLPRLPGIVCLHDLVLGTLFRAWGVSFPAAARRTAGAWYDHEVASVYLQRPGPPEEVFAEAAPMTEWIASMARGVLIHSATGLPRVLSACPGPVKVAPLPDDLDAMDTLGADHYARSLIDLAERVLVATPALETIDSFIKVLAGWEASGRAIDVPALRDPLRIFEMSEGTPAESG